jgi:hypothetical protein
METALREALIQREALVESLAAATFETMRRLIWQRKMTADEAVMVCRCTERFILLAGERAKANPATDLTLQMAAEAVEVELTGGLMDITDDDKSRIVN